MSMNNKPVQAPFYLKVDTQMSVWVHENEHLIMKAIRQALYRMKLHKGNHADEVYSSFLTYFVDRPDREQLAEKMDNLEGFMYKEAFNYTRTYSVRVFKRKEFFLQNESENERYGGTGITENYIKSEEISPEEVTMIKSDCDHIFSKLHLYDVCFREAGKNKLPARFSTLNWVASILINVGDAQGAAYSLGVSQATYEGWNRKVKNIVQSDPDKFEDLLYDIKTMLRGIDAGWVPPIVYGDDEDISDEDDMENENYSSLTDGYDTDRYGIETRKVR